MTPLSSFPASLPITPISSDVDAEKISLAFLPHLPTLTSSSFIASAIWRDLHSFTDSLRTFYEPDSILTVWNETSKVSRPSNFSLISNSAQIFRAGPACWIQAMFTFETEKTNCQAILALFEGRIEGTYALYPNGIAFADNTILPADVVILALGYQKNIRPVVAQMFSQSIADAMGDFWGVDSEGEFLGANRPGGQKAMFYTGGSQDSCRYFSRFIALSVKADVMGSPLPVYEG